MNSKQIVKQVGLLFIGTFLCFSTVTAKESTDNKNESKPELTSKVKNGMALFEGSIRFLNNGPACITCHNVTNNNLIPGGLFAKDLTETNGIMARSFAETLPNAPMKVSYGQKPITSEELDLLTAFFDYTLAHKDTQTLKSGYSIFFIGGGIGVVAIFIIVQILWVNRKKSMVKEDIFRRQKGAWDAKF